MRIMEQLTRINQRRKMLTPPQELELVTRWQETGCRKAQHDLLCAFMPLIRQECRFWISRFGHLEEDILQIGCIGFIKALDRFDPSRGLRLGTYAPYWIREILGKSITRMVSITKGPDQSALRVSLAVRRTPGALNDDGSLSLDKLEDVARIADTTPENALRAWEYRRVMFRHVSLNTPTGDGQDGEELMDMVAGHAPSSESLFIEEDEQAFGRRLLEEAFSVLDARERMIVSRRYQDPPDTLEVISRELGVTRERVRQVEKKALEKMRDRFLSHRLEGPLRHAVADLVEERGTFSLLPG